MPDSVASDRMKAYLVGGAVRDRLLGLPVADRDWVVVGETPEAMIAAGFEPVGKDFPVFLHPETHEEYALARTERKTAPGYHGFHFNTDTSVSLEDDLLRRDLTINAIAENQRGELIDPFNGQQDIAQKVLRHVSLAFTEDPVRILRLAKFMARFAHLDFTVAPETLDLVKSMVSGGEVDALVPERVWVEFEAALSANTPGAFFTTLGSADATSRIMPQMQNAFDRSINADTNADADMLTTLNKAALISREPRVRFAALCAGFRHQHASDLQSLCEQLRTPSAFRELALLSARLTEKAHLAHTLNAADLHALLKSLDAARRPERFNEFLLAASANTSDPAHYPQAQWLRQCAASMTNIDAAQIAKSQPNKQTISTAIKQSEIAAIESLINES